MIISYDFNAPYLSSCPFNEYFPAIKSWIKDTFAREKAKLTDLNIYIGCDEDIQHLNKRYFKRENSTDVIALRYEDKGTNIISGDIFINFNKVQENAGKYNVSIRDELFRVIIHGVLHLAGYKDETEVEKKEMRRKEDYYLKLLKL